MKHLLIVITIIFGLTACQTTNPINQAIIANANYGPVPENAEQLVKDFMSNTLKDPFTAQYQFRGLPYKAYIRVAPIMGGKPAKFGYIQEAMINAKNSYGAYVGWKPYRVFIADGQAIKEITPNIWFSEKWYRAY